VDKQLISLALGLAALLASPAQARVTAAEAAELGKSLTPVGAEAAGNKDGSIPAWTPGEQKGSLAGEFYTNPAVEAEKPLFVITKANMEKYLDKLSEGHKKLLSNHATYKLAVYPSHRLAGWPKQIYDTTIANATRCEIRGSDELNNCTVGFPFPIPKTGAEPIWNHKLRWRGDAVQRYNNQMIVQPSGEYQLTKIIEDVSFVYGSIKNPVTLTFDNGEYLRYMARTVAPPRVAGTTILVHEKTGTGTDGRAAWIYSPALKRVRRAPTVCCDNPAEGTDGHQFYDQVDMFNGTQQRYNWKLLGKKEMYVAYNPYRLDSPRVKYADIARPGHVNQDLARYELHRVWVVEAELRAGESHTFKKRRFYLDEDGWTMTMVDNYDNRGQLYEFQEGHVGFGYNIMASSSLPEVIYHFSSGRYFVTTLNNEDKPNNFTVEYKPEYFTAATVQKRATR